MTRNAPVGAEPSDLQLALEAAAGDPTAFEQLIRRWQPAVRGMVYRKLVVDDVVCSTDDVVQQVWVKVWYGLPGFRHDSAFGTWLYSIVQRTVLNDRRARRRRPQSEPLDAAAESSGRDALEDLAVREAIDSLPELERCVFLNKELFGYTWDENVGVSTTVLGRHVSLWEARQAYENAVTKLRRQLGDQ